MVTLQAFTQKVDGEDHLGLACITGKTEKREDGTQYTEVNVKAVSRPLRECKREKVINPTPMPGKKKKKNALPE